MPPPITSGLLWSTDIAIEFATSGPAVPAIPVTRASGPLYVIISYSQAATPGEDEPSIFCIGSPADNLWLTNTFYVRRSWGAGVAVHTAPGRGMMVDLPAPPSDFVGEFWAAGASSNMVSYLTPGWYMDPIPDHNPVATSHLFIGYKPDGDNAGAPAWRGAGTIHRMAIYDRVPTEPERAQLVAWANGGFPAISGDYIHYRQEDVTAAGVDSAHGMSMPLSLTGMLARATMSGIEWMDCADGVLHGTHAAWPASSGFAVWVLADGSRPTGTAIYNGDSAGAVNDNRHLNFHGDGVFRTTNATGEANRRTATWPVPPADGPETLCWSVPQGQSTIAGYSLRHNGSDLGPSTMTDPTRNASRAGTDFIIGGGSNLTPAGLRWRDIVVKVGGDFTPDEIAGLEAYAAERLVVPGNEPITATLAASDAPDTARIVASVRWPTITANVAAADASDRARTRAAVPVRARLAAADPPDSAAICATVGWPAITARLAAADAPDTAAVAMAVPIRVTLAAADAPDIARIIAGTGWPAIMARVAASDVPDRAAIHAAVPIRARLAAGGAPDSARLSLAVRIGVVLDAADAPDMARIIMRLWSRTSRYAWPGDQQGGVLAPSIRSGTIKRP